MVVIMFRLSNLQVQAAFVAADKTKNGWVSWADLSAALAPVPVPTTVFFECRCIGYIIIDIAIIVIVIIITIVLTIVTTTG